MPQGRFSIEDIIRVNPEINLKKLDLKLPRKGWTHYPKGGDFTSGPIREKTEEYDTKIFMKNVKGFIVCREHKEKECSKCSTLKP